MIIFFVFIRNVVMLIARPLDLTCVTYFFFYLLDEGLLSNISAGCGQLVKMLLTLEPHGMFELILFNIVQPLVCKMVRRLCRTSLGRSRSFSENAHNS